MIGMALTCFEPVPDELMAAIGTGIESRFPLVVQRLAPIGLPAGSWDAGRGQHSAPVFLQYLLQRLAPLPGKYLAVTANDLFIPMLTFVYGQAQLGGRAAVISLARLRQEYYALPASEPLLRERAIKEAVHETGHLFGLVHCAAPGCAMRVSTAIHQIDLKSDALCAACATQALEYER